MTILVRTLIGLIALFFIASGSALLLHTRIMAAEFAIAPNGVAGLSTIRGDLGGAFLAIGLLLGDGTSPRRATLAVCGRGVDRRNRTGPVVGFAFDGTPQAVVIPFSTELAFIAALVYAARRLRSEEVTEAVPKVAPKVDQAN